MYFGDKVDTLYTNGGLAAGVCLPELYQNTTHRILSDNVQSSVRIEYVNRVLTREQISWKNKSDEKPKKTTDSATSSAVQSINSTDSHAPTTGAAQNTTTPSESENDKDKNNKIHNHLVFLMLLPHHPYSQELRKIITTVTPMYPQATIVVGNAYEFKDMTTKYYVTSFPKILYFRSGIYLEAFEGAYTTEDVAAQLAEWTYSLPRAVPVPFARTRLARRTARLTRPLDIYAPQGQMRYGLALQPLPLTVQYTLLNVTVQLPEWVLQYLPWLHAGSGTNSGVGESKGGITSVVVGDSESVSSVSAVAAGDDTPEASVAVGELVESVTSVDGTTSASSGSSSGDVSGSSDGSTSSTYNADSAADSSLITNAAPTTHTTHSTHASGTTHYAEVPIQLSITVPMPNVEPFLGSLENYAVWDTRMFLLAGLYVIVRVLFLLRKWAFGAL